MNPSDEKALMHLKDISSALKEIVLHVRTMSETHLKMLQQLKDQQANKS
jgi:hypothetical protein